MGKALTTEERQMLEDIEEGDEGYIPAKSTILKSLVSARLVYIWEDGNFELHASITPAGRAALGAQP
jgi:hypothetical protein